MVSIYTCSLVFWLFLAFPVQYAKQLKLVNKKKLILGSFVLLFGTIMAFRGINVGTDTIHYSVIYDGIKYSDHFYSYYQFAKFPIYVILCRLISLLSDAPNAMIVFSSYVTVIAVAYVIYKKSENIIYSVFLYVVLDFYLYAFNASRQMLALSILLLVYIALEEKEIKKAVVLIIVAIGIHNLSILFVPIFALYYIKLSPKKALVINAVVFVFELLAFKLLEIFQRFFQFYGNLSNMGYNLVQGDSGGNRIVYAIIVLMIEFLAIWLNKKRTNWFYSESVLRMICIVNIGIFSMILYRHYYIFARIEKEYCQLLIILLPYMFNHLFKKNFRWLMYFMTGLLFMIPFVMKIDAYIPYDFWR